METETKYNIYYIIYSSTLVTAHGTRQRGGLWSQTTSHDTTEERNSGGVRLVEKTRPRGRGGEQAAIISQLRDSMDLQSVREAVSYRGLFVVS